MEDNSLLVKACLRNDRAAQRQLYEKFAGSMLGVCYRYTKSKTDAEDLLQDGFIRVFNKLEQFRGEGELGGWIRRIMVTTALNYLKSNAKYHQHLAFDKADLHPVTDDNPDVLLNTKQILSLIQQLPTGYQTIFNLYAIDGYSHVEIGEILGISDGTSRSQYARARALLISWMKTNYSDNKQNMYVK